MKSISLIVFLSLLILSFSLKDPKHLTKQFNNNNKSNSYKYYSENITINENNKEISFSGYFNDEIIYNNYTYDNTLFIRICNETENHINSPFLINNTFYYFPYDKFNSKMKMNIDSHNSIITLKAEISDNIDIIIQVKYSHIDRIYTISRLREYVDNINSKIDNNKVKRNLKQNSRSNFGWLYRLLYNISTKPSKYYTAINNDNTNGYRSLSYMTTKNLIAYNLSIIIANFIYYFVIL